MNKPVIFSLFLFLTLFVPALGVRGEEADTIRRTGHWGGEVSVLPGRTVSIDKYQSKWMVKQNNVAVDMMLTWSALPSDSNSFDADYAYPSLSAGLRLNMNHGVTMHKRADNEWPNIQEVDYDSQQGNIVSLYMQFSRPLFRTRKWETGYGLKVGTGWSRRKYNRQDAIDNEMIGSRWLVFFGAELSTCYFVTKNWGVKAGAEFYHHSNGALNRPNKGANVVAARMGVVYRPQHEVAANHNAFRPHAFKPYWFLNVAYAYGGRTMLEEWQHTQFTAKPGDADYRKEDFAIWHTHHFETSLMCRYARRWASGAGVDVIYGNYAREAEKWNALRGYDKRLSPWSVGVSAKHNVYYRRLSLQMAIGFYVYRNMGEIARSLETPYYERIGVAYDLGPFTVGANVKAHRTKADLTEVMVSLPFKL